MVQIEQLEYFKITSSFKNKPFNLLNAWIKFMKSKGYEIIYYVDSIKNPQILCWAHIKRIKYFGQFLSVEGPIFKENITNKQIAKFLKGLRSLPYKGVYINPNTRYSTAFTIAARKAGFKRPIGQSSINLTILVYPKELNTNRNWKRNLQKAHVENFEYDMKEELSFNDCKNIELLFKETVKMKNFKGSLKADQIKNLTNNNNKIFTFFLYKNGKPIVSRIISIDGHVSFDIFACNSLESRKNGASQYLMQKIFEYLRDHDIEYFDFSRIPIGKNGANGVYEFKNATGGKIIQYNGEWVYFNNKFLRHLLYLYNALINKEDFY